MDESSPKTSNLESTLLACHIEISMEVQIQAQVDDAIEIQVHVNKVEAIMFY